MKTKQSMQLNVYCKNELINTIKTNCRYKIYRELANIFRQRASVYIQGEKIDHVNIGMLSNIIMSAEVEFRFKNDVYTYVYKFKGVRL